MPNLSVRVDEALRGRYGTIRELDAEGRAHVYLARDLQRERDVALKAVPADATGDETAASFLASLRAAANLEHPHILTLLDFGESEGIAYSVAPYVEGASLADALREGPLEVERALSIALEIGEALEHAHARGVVHGAIRAENVLLSADHAELSFFDARGLAGGADVLTDLEGLGRLLRRMLPEDVPAPVVRLLYRLSPSAKRRRFRSAADAVDALRVLVDEVGSPEAPRRGLLEELKRRKVIGTALLYAGFSLALVEGGQAFAAPLGLPSGTSDFLALLAAFGFPLVIVLAWALDITATGIRWTEPRSLRAGSPTALRAARLRRVGAVALTGVVFVAGGFFALRRMPSEVLAAETSLDPRRIAVLEFEQAGTSGELAVLARELHERLVEGLSEAAPLRIASNLGVHWESVRADSVARLLQAGTLVWPRITAFGDSIRVVVRVLDGENGLQVASRTVQTALPQQLRLIDAVGDSVAELLRIELGEVIRPREWEREASSEAAFLLVIRAQDRMQAFSPLLRANDMVGAKRALDEADSLLTEAERLDPAWIDPLTLRRTVAEHRYQLAFAAGDPEPERALRQGIVFADRALERWPDHPDALYARGTLRYRLWEATGYRDDAIADAAEDDLRSAADRHPLRARVYERLAELLESRQRFDEARRYAELAYRQDPYRQRRTPNLLRLYRLDYELRSDTAALRWCDDGLARATSDEARVFHHCRLELMAWTEALPANADSAWHHLEGALAGYPPALRDLLGANLRGLVAGVLVRQGLPDSALAVVSAVRAGEASFGTVLPVAAVLARIDSAEEAVAVIRDFLDQHPDERADLLRRRELEPLWQQTDLFTPVRAGER